MTGRKTRAFSWCHAGTVAWQPDAVVAGTGRGGPRDGRWGLLGQPVSEFAFSAVFLGFLNRGAQPACLLGSSVQSSHSVMSDSL